MANELNLSINLDQKIFSDLRQVGQEFKKFFDDVKKDLTIKFDLPKQDIGIGKISKELSSIKTVIKSATDELDRSIDDINQKSTKVLDNIFVGTDNLFSFTRKLRLKVGEFFGDSKSTLINIINDVIKFFREFSPILASLSKSFNKNRMLILDTIKLVGSFLSNTVSKLEESRKKSDHLTGQAKKFLSSSEFSGLQALFKVRQLPVTERIGIFFEQSRIFFNNINTQIEKIVQILGLAFNISRKELEAIDQKAKSISSIANKSVNEVGPKVISLFNKVQEQVVQVEKQAKGFFSRIFGGLGAVIAAPFKLIGNIIFGGKRRRQAEQEAARKRKAEQDRINAEIEAERLKNKALDDFRTNFLKRDAKERQESQNKAISLFEKEKEQIHKIQDAILGFTGTAKKSQQEILKTFSPNVFEDFTRELNFAIKELNKVFFGLANTLKGVFSVPELEKFRNILIDISKQLDSISRKNAKPSLVSVASKKDDFGVNKSKNFNQNLKESLKKEQEEFKKSLDASEKLKDSIAKTQDPIKKVDDELKKVAADTKNIVDIFKTIDFSKFQKIESFKFVSKGDTQFIQEFKDTLRGLSRISFGQKESFLSQSLESANKKIPTVVSLFRELDIVLKTGNNQFSKIADEIKKLGFKAPKNVESAKKSLEVFFQTVRGESLKSRKDLANIGAGFTIELSKAIKGGDKKQLEKVLNDLVAFISEFFPQSPAKRGALKKLPKSGGEIVNQIANGIKDNIEKGKKAAKELSDNIAAYFPQSLAKLGSLRKLPIAGKLIPSQLATAMLQNASVVADAAKKLAGFIFTPIQATINQITNIGSSIKSSVKESIDGATKFADISRVTGVGVRELDKIDVIFRQVGETAENSLTTISRIQRTLSKDTENQKFLTDLGVNFEEVKNSAEPTLALIQEVSGVLQNLPVGSEESRKAIEALGLTMDNKLVGVLRKGSDNIKSIVEESKAFGNSFNPILVESSEKTRTLLSTIDRIKQTLINDFVTGILPSINQVIQEIIGFVTANAPTIRGIFVYIGTFLGNIILVAKDFFKLLINEPGKAYDIAVILISTFSELVSKLFSKLVGNIRKNITEEIKANIGAALGGIKESAFDLFSFIAEQFDLRLAKFLLQIEEFTFNLDETVVNFSNKFLSRTTEVFGRWLKGGQVTIEAFLESVTDFFKNARDKATVFFLTIKNIWLITLKIIEEGRVALVGSLADTTLLDDINKKLKESSTQIKHLKLDIKAREKKEDIFTRISEELGKINSETKSSKDLIEELNKDIEKSNSKFVEKVGSNFKKAFSNAQKLIEETKKATSGIFDKEAVEEYKKAVDEAIQKVKETVEGTDLKESTEKLISDLKFSAIEAIQDVRDKAPDLNIGSNNENQQETKDNLDGILETFQATETGVKNISQVFSTMFGSIAKESKEAALAVKAASLLEAIVSTAAGVANALKLPFPLNIAQSAVVAAQGGAQVATIAGAGIQGFNEGGFVEGPSGIDKVGAYLTAGEFVIPKERVQDEGVPFFEGIRKGLIKAKDVMANNFPSPSISPVSRRFETGGFVKPVSPNQTESKKNSESIVDKINVINVNEKDEDSLSRALASKKGEVAFFNFLSNRAPMIRKKIGL